MVRSRGRTGRRGRAALAAGVAVLTLAGGAVTAGSASADGTAWVPTATRALKLSHAVPLGSAPDTSPLRITVGLAIPNRSALDALIRAQQTPGNAEYHHYLTPDQFTARFAPSPESAAQVAQYLTSAGFTGVAVAPNRLQVTAQGTAGQAQQAFHTRIDRFQQSGRTVLANTAPALVPAALGRTVSGVLGLSTLGAHTESQPGLPKTSGYFPKDFQAVYNAGGTPTGSGTSIAIIAQGNLAPTITDLRTAEAQQNLPQVPVNVIPTGPNNPDTSGQVEWDLDSQTSTGMAQSVRQLSFYDATTLSDSDLARAFNAFAARNTEQAASASLGECDLQAYLNGGQVIDDAAFAEAAAQGQSFFASSGDTGASCPILDTNGVPDSGPVNTNYPASSPYVTGVGGTTLVTDDANRYQNEIAWNAGGGGISPDEAPGFWQANANPIPAMNNSSAINAGRGVPDIAFDADPTTGALIYNGPKAQPVGGTSLSSPLALGAWARLESAHGNGIGFASAALYGLYNRANPAPTSRNATAGFHDVTLGTNGLFVATPGWDFTTGIGSFDLAHLNQQLH